MTTREPRLARRLIALAVVAAAALVHSVSLREAGADQVHQPSMYQMGSQMVPFAGPAPTGATATMTLPTVTPYLPAAAPVSLAPGLALQAPSPAPLLERRLIKLPPLRGELGKAALLPGERRDGAGSLLRVTENDLLIPVRLNY